MAKNNGNQCALPGHYSLVDTTTGKRINALPAGTSERFEAAKSWAKSHGDLAVHDPRGSHVAGPAPYKPPAPPPAPPTRTSHSSGLYRRW